MLPAGLANFAGVDRLSLAGVLLAEFLWIGSVACLILGLVNDNSIMFRFGPGGYCFCVLGFLGFAFYDRFYEMDNQSTSKPQLFVPLLFGFVVLPSVSWLVFLILVLIHGFLKAWRAITDMLGKPKTPRIGFLAIGCIMLLAGLVLQLVGTYQ